MTLRFTIYTFFCFKLPIPTGKKKKSKRGIIDWICHLQPNTLVKSFRAPILAITINKRSHSKFLVSHDTKNILAVQGNAKNLSQSPFMGGAQIQTNLCYNGQAGINNARLAYIKYEVWILNYVNPEPQWQTEKIRKRYFKLSRT